MDNYFVYSVNNDISKDKENIIKFLDYQDNVVIEQYPDWPSKGHYRYFYIKKDGAIIAYAKLQEIYAKMFRFARLDFGPVFKNMESGYNIIDFIISYYKKNKFNYISIQLGLPVSNETEYIDHKINQKYKVKYIYKSNNHWCSLRINLDSNIDDLFSNFRKGHKSAIKKAFKILDVREIKNEVELREFFSVFHAMSIERNIYCNILLNDIYNIYKYLIKYKKGYFIGVFTKDNKCIGGIVLVSNGKGMRYYLGASDANYRKLPILHAAIYYGIEICLKTQKDYLDLWGYNLYAKQDDPILGINHFKKGFSDNLIFYPKRMHVILKPFGKRIYDLALDFHNIIKK